MKNRKLNYALLLLFTILVLYITLKNNFMNIYNNIINLNPYWVMYALFLMFTYWFYKALIIKTYINYYNKNFSFKSSMKLEMENLFFNGITPFSSGGQPFQILSMKKEGVRMSDGTNITFITSFIHQFALFLISFVAIVANQFLNLFKINTIIKYLSILGFVINVIFMIFLLVLMFNKKFKNNIVKVIVNFLSKLHIVKHKLITIHKWEEKMDVLHESSKIIVKNKRGFIKAIIYNIIALLAYFLVPLTLMYGMGLNSFNALEAIITSSYVVLIGMFVPIPGGTGGLEYAFVALFSNFVSSNIVAALMLVWRFITYYLGIILGAITLNINNKDKWYNE